jgi:mRNA-degrading endonuclease RelE of RelBE toxin-antitoxin system
MKVKQQGTQRLHFGKQVILTPDFLRTWKALQQQQRQQIEPKIRLLAANPRHPSLNVHRHHQVGGDIWICYLSRGQRLLYAQQGATLYLYEVGSHTIVDRAHERH